MNREEFIKSYENTITNMDIGIVRPFSETEIQPLYSNEWIKDTIRLDINPINSSVSRSMFIMDIFDLYYSNAKAETINRFVEKYDKIFKKLYKEDEYSLNFTNIPNDSRYEFYEDYSYFINKNIKNDNLLGFLFSYCYGKWGDMFADNSYEITGPHKIKNYKVINNKFFVDDLKYNVLQYFDKDEDVKIDMFGHSIANNCLGKVVLKNGSVAMDLDYEIKIMEDKNLENVSEKIDNKECMLMNKLYRYSGRIDRKKYIDIIKNKPLHEKITKPEELVSIVKEVLLRRGYNE
jgi:hypothetical protein